MSGSLLVKQSLLYLVVHFMCLPHPEDSVDPLQPCNDTYVIDQV